MFLRNSSENCDIVTKPRKLGYKRNIQKMNMPHANIVNFGISTNSTILEYSDENISILLHSGVLIIHLSSLSFHFPIQQLCPFICLL